MDYAINLRAAIATSAICLCTTAGAAQVSVRWAQPGADAPVSDSIQLQLTGEALKNVEIFREGIRIADADVAADGKSATALINTRQFANGEVTLTARASDSEADEAATSEADAGALQLTVSNSLRMSNTREKFGVFIGNQPLEVLNFEAWLGRQVDAVLSFTGAANWTDYEGSVGWAAYSVWGQVDRPVYWSIPLIPNGATLAEAATGAYNEHYRKVAQVLVRARPTEPYMHIRTGWEFNGDWMPWSAIGKEQEFIGAFQQFVTTFREVARENGTADKFVFEWNVALGNHGMNPEDAYPGDNYVDIIGMDFYWNPKYDPKDPIPAWVSKVNRQYGLKWHQTFAAAHAKRTAYPEWGVQGDNAGPYIERARWWFRKHAPVYQAYWDSNSAFPGKLSSEQYPSSAAAYYKAFHRP
jgi:hypothetical protein